MTLRRALILLLLVGATFAAGAAQAVTCVSDLRVVVATCGTADAVLDGSTDLATCMVFEEPPGSWIVCFSAKWRPLPLADYALCYYRTAPQSWVATCA